MTIYVDILILTNIFVTYFLLSSVRIFLKLKTKRIRLISACLLGGIYSLLILIDYINPLLFNLLKILMAILLVFTAFGRCKIKIFIKRVVTFYVINFMFAGFMFLIYYKLSPENMAYNNSVVYFDISALSLAVCTIIAYLIIRIVSYFMTKNIPQNEIKEIIFSLDGNEALVSAFVDTGNKLLDVITGKPVVVCEFEAIKDLIPKEYQSLILSLKLDNITSNLWRRRIRLIPIKTVTGSSIVTALTPDNAYLILPDNSKREISVIVGIIDKRLSDGDFNAITGDFILKE